MSAEYAAERIMDALSVVDDFELPDSEADMDMRTGGSFFDVTLRGKTYEVLVVQIRQGGAS